MLKKIIGYYLFFFLVSSVYADNYENKIVEKIDIILKSNNPEIKFDSQKLLSQLKTKEKSAFNLYVFDEDLKKLSSQFQGVSPSFTSKDNSLFITIYITPKPKIVKINWSGNKIASANKLKKELGINLNTPFSREKFNTALNKIKDFYIKKGFFQSSITYKTEVIPNKDEIIVNVNIVEGKSGKITNIVFKGLTDQEIREVKRLMYSKTYKFWLSWLTGEGLLKTEGMEQDQIAIINYFNNKGYADAKVKFNFKDNEKKPGIIVEILVHKGKIYHLGDISISGNTLFTKTEIEKQLSIKKRDIYSPEKIRENTQIIKDIYGNKGYIETEVFQEVYLTEKHPIYDVNFEIEEGDQFKIGLVRIFGNKQTKSNVILRESLLIPGKVFDCRRLKATQKRLENMGYFKNVNVYTVKPINSTDNALRDVNIEVEETTTGSASISLGFSSTDDIYGSFELAERNFNIRGLSSLFSAGPSCLRGGGEYVNAKATVGKEQRAYYISWMDPYFRDSLWRFGFDASKTTNKLQSKDYNITTYGGSVFTSYPITNYWTFGTKYRLRHTNTDLKNAETIQDRAIEENHGIVSAIGSSISYDSTDNPYKAHRGIRSALELEYTGIWGDFYFLKLAYVNNVYIPLRDRLTLKFRFDFKFLEPILNTNTDELPLSEKFFLGGEKSVRGYKPYILGPRRTNKTDDPIGGISSSLLSAECSFMVHKMMDLFVFFDSGSVSDKHFSIPKLNSSYGVGVRLDIMNRMPITLGYGIPINPDYPDDKQKFFYSMGGQF